MLEGSLQFDTRGKSSNPPRYIFFMKWTLSAHQTCPFEIFLIANFNKSIPISNKWVR